jgi:hypothetical protein
MLGQPESFVHQLLRHRLVGQKHPRRMTLYDCFLEVDHGRSSRTAAPGVAASVD